MKKAAIAEDLESLIEKGKHCVNYDFSGVFVFVYLTKWRRIT